MCLQVPRPQTSEMVTARAREEERERDRVRERERAQKALKARMALAQIKEKGQSGVGGAKGAVTAGVITVSNTKHSVSFCRICADITSDGRTD